MTFLSPLFLLGAVAAAVPIVLHLLKREPEARVKFSAVRLLRQAPVEHTSRRHLSELLLLMARVAALLLLSLAFARPFFAAGAASPSATVTVVALDTSLSLSAPGQFDRTLEQARDAIANAETTLVGVVSFADAASIAAAPTGDRAAASAALDALSPGYGATRYDAALSGAVDLLDGRAGRIVVVTDMQASGWAVVPEAAVPENVEVQVVDVGAPPANLAVVGARRAGDRVIAVARNTGAEAREARVRMTIDGRPGPQATAIVPGRGTADVPLPATAGREAVITVEDASGVPGDNARYLLLDREATPAVLVLTASGDLEREALYLRHALAADGVAGAAYEVEGVSGAALSAWDPARMDRYAAVMLVSTRGIESRGRELIAGYVKSGGGVLVAAGPGVDAEVAAGALGGILSFEMPAGAGRPPAARSLAPADARHPVFQAFGDRASALGLVRFRRVATMEVNGDACDPLATFTTGETALLECRAGEGRILALASDLNNAWNDFPLHPAFVPFVHEAVRHLAGVRPLPDDEYLVGALPPGTAPQPGFMEVADAGRVAVNVDPAEATADTLSAAQFEASIVRVTDRPAADAAAGAHEVEERQHVWQYVLGLMVAILVLESAVGAKTS